MDYPFLENGRLAAFLETLRGFGELHGPTLSDAGVAGFSALADPAQVQLDYGRTLIPPKKYLLPFREEFLLFREASYRYPEHPPRQVVLFGVHPCDLDGIAYLDAVFLADPPDPSYVARRAGLALIGLSCQPDDFCFCSEFPGAAPCDLFLYREAGGFFLQSGSARGDEMLRAARELLVEAAFSPVPGGSCGTVGPQDPGLRHSGNPLWDRFAEICLSCGACSVCCPTCYCFDVREYPRLSGGAGRLREWDNCLFESHGEVAGANFRPTRLERLRYRFLHKYCGFTPLQGISSCVGCGRCKAACPVGIDLRELIPSPGEPAGVAR